MAIRIYKLCIIYMFTFKPSSVLKTIQQCSLVQKNKPAYIEKYKIIMWDVAGGDFDKRLRKVLKIKISNFVNMKNIFGFLQKFPIKGISSFYWPNS